MKKLIMICGLLFGLGALANAQDAKPAGGQGRMGMNPEARVKQLDEKLKLTEDQKTKLTTIFTDQVAAQKKQREEGAGASEDRAVRMERMQKQRADLETKIGAVLNDDQNKTYHKMMEEQKAEMQKRMQERQKNPGK